MGSESVARDCARSFVLRDLADIASLGRNVLALPSVTKKSLSNEKNRRAPLPRGVACLKVHGGAEPRERPLRWSPVARVDSCSGAAKTFPPPFPPCGRNGLDVQVTPRSCAFNYLALPVTARNSRFRIPKLNVAGSNPVSRSQVGRRLVALFRTRRSL